MEQTAQSEAYTRVFKAIKDILEDYESQADFNRILKRDIKSWVEDYKTDLTPAESKEMLEELWGIFKG